MRLSKSGQSGGSRRRARGQKCVFSRETTPSLSARASKDTIRTFGGIGDGCGGGLARHCRGAVASGARGEITHQSRWLRPWSQRGWTAEGWAPSSWARQPGPAAARVPWWTAGDVGGSRGVWGGFRLEVGALVGVGTIFWDIFTMEYFIFIIKFTDQRQQQHRRPRLRDSDVAELHLGKVSSTNCREGGNSTK